ncbi:MAG: membrane-associated phospholipid phosphatase [Candidatus Krumholzibacteriia bacterium]|jgi:membrane-associated phospholipid phosphatase
MAMLIKGTGGRLVCVSLCLLLLMAVPVNAADKKYETDSDVESTLAASTILLFGAGYLLNPDRAPFTEAEIEALDPKDVNAFDRSAISNWSPGAARASDIMASGSLVAPLTLLASDAARDEGGVIGLMYLETALLSAGMTYLIKNISGRTRPYVYSDNPDIPLSAKMESSARRSFSSGHTSTAFSSLVFLATVFDRLHPESSARGWVWGGCLAAASTTGYLRYAAGRHFPTDIIAGAAVGAFAGWVVPKMHELDAIEGDLAGKSRSSRQSVIGFSVGF